MIRSELRSLRRALLYPPLWVLLVLFGAALIAAYQQPHDYRIDVGNSGDGAYALNFHSLIDYGGTQSRWTDQYAYISLPGIGGGVPLSIDLRVAGGTRPDDVPATLDVLINGVPVINARELGPDFETLNIETSDPQVLAQRDLVIELRATTFLATDVAGEHRGVLVDWAQVRQGGGFIVPTQRVLICLVGALLLLFLWLVRANFRRRVAFALSVIVAALLVALLATAHLPLSAAAPHLLTTAISAYVLLVVAQALLTVFTRIPHPASRIPATLFAAGWALRYGAMALPQAAVIDMPYHMKWLRILLGGDWQALYYPGQLSSVPPEWGLSVLIPKSPLFYFFVAPLGWLPFDLASSVKWVVTLMDASTILFAYLLARRWLGGTRAALWAAALYAVLPLSFRSLLYGILPTIQGQWMTWFLFMLLLWQWPRINRPPVIVGMTLLLAATLVAFPTLAVFNVLVLLGLALWWRRERGRALALVGTVVLAGLLAVVVYYGQYIEPVFGTTLPAMLDQLSGHGPAGQGAGTTRWPGGPLETLGWTLDYEVSFLPLVGGAVGLALLWPLRKRRFVQMLVLWIGVGVLFLVANYFVDMIGKHLYYTMLPLCILAGVTFATLYRRRGAAGMLAALSLLAVAWSGVSFWFGRIVP